MIIGARQGSGGLKCSRTFLSPMKGSWRTEVDFWPLPLFLWSQHWVYWGARAWTLILLGGQLVTGSASCCLSHAGPPHALGLQQLGKTVPPDLPITATHAVPPESQPLHPLFCMPRSLNQYLPTANNSNFSQIQIFIKKWQGVFQKGGYDVPRIC